MPAQPEWAVSGSGVIGERELRTETGTPRTGVDGNGERTGAGHRVGGELLAYPSDRAAAPGQRDGGLAILLAVTAARFFLIGLLVIGFLDLIVEHGTFCSSCLGYGRAFIK